MGGSRQCGFRQAGVRAQVLRGAGAALLLAGLALPSACMRDCTPQVRDGWVRMPPGAATMMAGFGRIENACPTPATIVAVRSPAFAGTSLHETRLVGGISRMRAVPELRIPPDDVAVLKPGGLHLMLMQPNAPLKTGSKVAVQFELADGRELLGEFQVRTPPE
ncbi:MAG: copper chaperone PCu(A)C [Gammaproteobacteria bacterium]|nr:copper chaperone PCu(A)C [Gammaproteobacteria bacterium]